MSWTEAEDHIGEIATVCGPVINDTYYLDEGNSTVFNIGVPYPDPDRFGVVIPAEQRGNFPGILESHYLDKLICINGLTTEQHGIAAIQVTDVLSKIRLVAH